MVTSNSNRLQSVVKLVSTSPAQPFIKPQARPTSLASSQSHAVQGLPWEMTAPEAWDPKIVSYEDSIDPNWTKEERLMFEFKSGHFTVEEGDQWSQAEVDAVWAR